MAQEEGKIQKKITNCLVRDGWFVTKLLSTTTSGIPDVYACKDGKSLFVEVKTEKGKTSKIQEFRISQLIDKGMTVFVSYGYADFLTEYELYKKTNK